MNFTLTLNKVNESDFNKVGYRALDLAKIAQGRIEVPPCFVIPNLFFDVFLTDSGLDVKIQQILRHVSLEDSESLKDAVGKIRGLFKNTKIPNEYVEQLKEAYDALAINISSSSAQDFLVEEEIRVNIQISPNYLTDSESTKGIFLNVKGFEDFCDAVKSSWMSLFSSSEITYRFKKGIKKFNAGIIVQKMITLPLVCEVYTKGSFADFDFLMKGYRGLPDITKQITKDEYSVTSETLKINAVAVRRQEFALLPSEKSTILIKRSLGKRGEGQKISNRQISELGRLAKKVKSLVSTDVKIIFGLDDSSSFCILVNRLGSSSDLKKEKGVEASFEVESRANSSDSAWNKNKYGVKDNFTVESSLKKEIEEFKEIDSFQEQSVDARFVNSETDKVKDEGIHIQQTESSVRNVVENTVQDTEADSFRDSDLSADKFQNVESQNVENAEEPKSDFIKENVGDIGDVVVDEPSEEFQENKIGIVQESNDFSESNIVSGSNGVLQNSEASGYPDESSVDQQEDFILEDIQENVQTKNVIEENIVDESDVEKGNVEENVVEEGAIERDNIEYYLSIIDQHEPVVREKVFALYREKYGDEPLSVEDALARLSENIELEGLDAVQVMNSIKKRLLSGEMPNLGNFEEIIREVKRFPGG